MTENFSLSLPDISVISSLFIPLHVPLFLRAPSYSHYPFMHSYYYCYRLSLSLSLSRVLFSVFQTIMEPQQHQHQVVNEDGGGGGKGGFLCRQSSTRWTPTTDQIRILKDLYYNNGVRSPSAEQIQRISARLRQYGKIEGKNVFYWFQNHKARERQKKRFTNDINPMQQQRGVSVGVGGNFSGGWRSEDSIYNKYPNLTPGVASLSSSCCSASPAGVLTVNGQMGNYGYGSVTMEKSFRDCSISQGGSGGGCMGHNFGWAGVDSYTSSHPFFDKTKSVDETLEEEEQEDQTHEIETLPLFPIHADSVSGYCNTKPESDGYYSGLYNSDNGKPASRTSLELSLNSYSRRSPDFV